MGQDTLRHFQEERLQVKLRPITFVLLAFILLNVLVIRHSQAKAASAKARTPQIMFEPLFAIKYSPTEVKFEPAPDEIFKCEDLRTPRSKLSLFGKVIKNGIIFYYVYGLYEIDLGEGPTGQFEAQHDDGTIVVVSPNGCQDISAGYAWTQDPKSRRHAEKLGITDDVVSALISDAVDREVKAFGGVTKFLAKVKAAGIPESNLDPQVRAELQALRKKAKIEKKQKAK